MAFYDYIVLDGYRYKTIAKQWRPSTQRAVTSRMTLQGSLEGTFGVGATKHWMGLVSVPHGEESPGAADGTLYGNITTLRASLVKTQTLSFTDHNGSPYTVYAQGPFEENTLTNVWNSTANKYYVTVHLVAKG